MTVDMGMLKKIAAHMRKEDIRILGKSGSGHPGGSLSIIELLSLLYFGKIMKYDSQNPQWADRDRLILSKGHTCPALYIALAYAGFFPKKELDTLRQFESRLQGHTDLNLKTPGVETSGGPLGQGLSVAVGMAIAAKMDGRKSVIYTIIGDGESAKGGISEAAKSAGVMKLDNIITFLDYNKVDQDGAIADVQPCQFVQEWQGYGWATIEVDGNDITKLHAAIQAAHTVRKDQHVPVLLLMDTIKGAGISFMAESARQGSAAWHGVTPKKADLDNALMECDQQLAVLDAEVDGDIEAYIQSIQLTLEEKEEASIAVEQHIMEAPEPAFFIEGKATRDAFGKYIVQLGHADSRIVAVTAGVAGSVRLNQFEEEFGRFSAENRSGRFVNVGIAEANMAGVAAGLALAGKKPWMATFDIFVKECLGVIRNSVCYNDVDVKIIGTHGGLGVGQDGGSHQSTIVPGIMNDLFRMESYEPGDVNEAMSLMKLMYEQNKSAYFRLTRQKVPLLPNPTGALSFVHYEYGNAARIVRNVLEPQVLLLAVGGMVDTALQAADVLEKEGIIADVLDVYSLSHLDTDQFRALIIDVPLVCLHDAHYKILAREVAYSLAQVGRGQKIVSIGMKDFGESGKATELYKKHGMDVVSVLAKVRESL
jgi:transketolase